jgi:hypothetical protein
LPEFPSFVALSVPERIFPTIPIQDRRMDAAPEAIPAAAREDYKSRPGALIWFFKKSRDNRKDKYRSLKVSVQGLKNQLAAVTRSRAEWRAEAEGAGRRAAALEAELAEVRGRIAAAGPRKTSEAMAR